MSIKIENIAPLTTMEECYAELLSYVAAKGKIAPLMQYAVEDEFGRGSVMTERVTQAQITTIDGLNAWKERVAMNNGIEYNIPLYTSMSETMYMVNVTGNGVLKDLIMLPVTGDAVTVYEFNDKVDGEVSIRLGMILQNSASKLRDHTTNHMAARERQQLHVRASTIK